jgi:hypothetical protein
MNDKDYFYYYVFCLGYDFMNDFYKNSESPECDVVFEKCKTLVNEFMNSEEYKNYMLSSYDSLEEWLKNNKDKIIGSYSQKENVKHKNIERSER